MKTFRATWPDVPRWEGMDKRFMDVLGRVWYVITRGTLYPPYMGATRKEIGISVRWLRWLPSPEPIIHDVLDALLQEGFIKHHKGFYTIVKKREYGRLYTMDWGGQCFIQLDEEAST